MLRYQLKKDISGYWSSGSRLNDSMHVGGLGVGGYDLPEYIVSQICFSDRLLLIIIPVWRSTTQ